MKQPVFTGSGVAIVTPFTKENQVDYPSLRSLLHFQLTSGTDAIIVCGTTGEAATLTSKERQALIAFCVQEVGGQVPVIAGTGSNCTASAVAMSKDAQQLGVDALLVVTPYYNKTTQDGLIRHYNAIADAVALPLIIYNVPSRTGVCCSASTYAQLSAHPNIAGVKEASGNFDLIQDTRNLCPQNFFIWSGNDAETAATCMLGGSGVISTAANIIPSEMHQLTQLCLMDRFQEAGIMQLKMQELIRSLFCEVNPIPVKTALGLLGRCQPELRLPLCPMTPAHQLQLVAAMEDFGLL